MLLPLRLSRGSCVPYLSIYLKVVQDPSRVRKGRSDLRKRCTTSCTTSWFKVAQ